MATPGSLPEPPLIRHIISIAAAGTVAGVLASPAAATSQHFGAWSVKCLDEAGGRHCSMTTTPEIRVRGNVNPSPPIVFKWRAVNAAAGIVESAEAAIDAEILPGWRLSALFDGENLLARPDGNARLPSSPMLERLLAGQGVSLMLVHEERGNRAIARVAANGFGAARTELMHELKEHGSNRR